MDSQCGKMTPYLNHHDYRYNNLYHEYLYVKIRFDNGTKNCDSLFKKTRRKLVSYLVKKRQHLNIYFGGTWVEKTAGKKLHSAEKQKIPKRGPLVSSSFKA